MEGYNMNNKAISWKSDEHFTKCKLYDCSNVYNNMIDIMDNEGKMIKVDLEDKDFTFILNPSEEFMASNMEIRELMGL
jgi:hypothetical protein